MANKYLPHMQTPIIRKGWIALGVLVLLGGGWISYYFQQNPSGIGEHNSAYFRCLTVTIIGAGLCFICGTAQWWLKK